MMMQAIFLLTIAYMLALTIESFRNPMLSLRPTTALKMSSFSSPKKMLEEAQKLREEAEKMSKTKYVPVSDHNFIAPTAHTSPSCLFIVISPFLSSQISPPPFPFSSRSTLVTLATTTVSSQQLLKLTNQ